MTTVEPSALFAFSGLALTALYGVIKWLDIRTAQQVLDAKADLLATKKELLIEIDGLRIRVSTGEARISILEHGNALAKSKLRQAYKLAVEQDLQVIASLLEEAESCLN